MTKSDEATVSAPISGYDYITADMIKKIEAALKHAKVDKHLAVKEFGPIVATKIYSAEGLLCSNCGADLASEDQVTCGECGIGYSITLFIGV